MSNLQNISLKLLKVVAFEAKLVFGFYSPVGRIVKINWIDHTYACRCKHHPIPHQQASWKITPALPAITSSLCTGCCLTRLSDPPWVHFSQLYVSSNIWLPLTALAVTGRGTTLFISRNVTANAPFSWLSLWDEERIMDESLKKGSSGDRHCYYITAS